MGKYIMPWDEDPSGHQEMAHADRKGWKTNTTLITGGEQQDALYEAGPEVGNPYSNGDDVLGEERTKVTYKGRKAK